MGCALMKQRRETWPGSLIGCARVSAGEQNLQLDALNEAKCSARPRRIRLDNVSTYSSSRKWVQEPNTGNGNGRTLFGSLIRKAISSPSKTFLTEMETPDVGMQSEQRAGNYRTDVTPAGNRTISEVRHFTVQGWTAGHRSHP